MSTNQAILQSVFGLFLLLPNLSYASSASTGEFEITRYRFQRHSKQGYERLVLEFQERQGNRRARPEVTLYPEKNNLVQVSPANLVGGAPEAAINDMILARARNIMSIRINGESTGGGFSLNVLTKSSKKPLHTFWLNSPHRLVIDAYDSSAKLGHAGHGGGKWSMKKRGEPNLDAFNCYPALSQVNLSVVFQPRPDQQDEELQNIHVNLRGAAEKQEVGFPEDAIVCFPKSAQVTASLAFEDAASRLATNHAPPLMGGNPLLATPHPSSGHNPLLGHAPASTNHAPNEVHASGTTHGFPNPAPRDSVEAPRGGPSLLGNANDLDLEPGPATPGNQPSALGLLLPGPSSQTNRAPAEKHGH